MSYFQLTNKRCNSAVCDGKIIRDPIFNNDDRTWSYHPNLRNLSIELGQIYANGATIDAVCPPHLKNEWDEVKRLHLIYEKSFREAKINLNEFCLYDFIPENFVIKFFSVKNEITKFVFENYKKPLNYNHLRNLIELTNQINKKELKIDYDKLNHYDENDVRVKTLKRSLKGLNPKINYDVFGTITGRFSTKKNSFPILNLDNRFKEIIKPNNHYFVELDYNAFELRVFLALNKMEQPQQDIHDWNRDLFNQQHNKEISRDEMKVKVFAWLYGTENEINVPEIEKGYNKETILNEFFRENYVKTIYNRFIPSTPQKAVSLTIQSTAADLFFESVLACNELLKNKKSYIAMLIHDSMILDVNKEDLKFIKEVIKTFSLTRFGTFKTRAKLGKDLGNLKQIDEII
jgi:hypothetical protein